MARRGKCPAGWVVAVCLLLWASGRCQGYVMPADQILKLTAANFTSFETLTVTQTVEIQGPEAGSKRTRFDEKVWMKSPDLIRAQRLGQAAEEAPVADRITRLLFVRNSEAGLMRFLSDLGIDPELVGFSRVEGMVAYRIGDRGADSPKLLIDKKKFLPLRLLYRPVDNPGQGLITLRFEDFRKREGGFYPFKTTCEFSDGTIWTYFVSEIRPNEPVDPSLFPSGKRNVPTGALPGAEQAAPEEERLKEVIQNLEQEYR